MLLVVPGFVFYVWFALAGVVVKVERRRVLDSLRRSRDLVRGSFWRVAAVVIPAELLSSAVVDVGQEVGHDLVEGFAGEWLGATLGEFLAVPLYAVAIVVVTFQLLALDGAANLRPRGRRARRPSASSSRTTTRTSGRCSPRSSSARTGSSSRGRPRTPTRRSAVAREEEPDVVILDWMMPGGGGAKAAAEISATLPDTRIVGITAGDAAVASYEMGTHGAVAFLQKGFGAAELVEAIRSATRW